MAAPDPELIGRFRRDLEAITGESPTPVRRLGLAVSGGPDSMALLLLAAAAWPDAVAAATVDHGLREASAGEAAMVREICNGLGVPHETLAVPAEWLFGEDVAGSLLKRAREARYRLLEHWARGARARARWIATAHHRDDVAESFLMRARRGSGIGGLAEMPRARALLVRPLLDWDRGTLACMVKRAGITPADDPSNTDPRFDRSRIRRLLADTPELTPGRLALSARNLRYAEDALQWATDREYRARVRDGGDGTWIDASDLPYEIVRRLVASAIQDVRGRNGFDASWERRGVDRLARSLIAGNGGTLAGVQARVVPEGWHFRLAPPRRSH